MPRHGIDVLGRHRHGRHATAGNPLPNHALDFGGWRRARGGRGDDVGPALGAAAVCAVTGRASVGEDLRAAGFRRLRGGWPHGGQDGQRAGSGGQ